VKRRLPSHQPPRDRRSARCFARLRLPALVLVLLLATTGLAGCTSSDGRSVTIYSGRTSDLVAPILERFAKESGISVDVRYGDSPDLALLINEEGDKSPADVFLSQSPGAIGYIDSQDLLRELPASILDQVPDRFRATDDDWVGISGRVRVLAYNSDKIDAADLPASIYGMTDPKYRGRVGIAPPNASFIDFVTAMRELTDDGRTLAWLEGLKANDVQTYPNNIAILDAINRGEIDYGLVNHYYNEQAKAEDPGIASENYVFPDGDIGALILVTAAGILKTGDHTAEAEELIDFLLAKEAQEFFADETFEYPLAAGVRPSVEDLPPLDQIASPKLELSSLGEYFKTTRDLIQQAGLEDS
jgi:iron(III) transport system substrate-binding protein